MKPIHKNVLLLLSLTSLLGGCEVKKNLDEMHDNTAQMNERTTELKTATGELYDALRQGDSLSARRAALDNLMKTKDPARKLSESAKYFMSFEFQFWTNEGPDKGDQRRLQLAKDAALEFFKDVQQFIPDMDMTPNPMAGQIIATENSNLVNCLNSLAVAMHYLNPKQELRLHQNPEMAPMSIYRMIEESLLAKPSIESGEKNLSDFPGYVPEILANENIAIYLLEARYNYLMTIMLGKSTKIAHDKLVAVSYIAGSWDLDLSKFNVAQTEEMKMFISGALKTKALLNKVGVNPRTEFKLKKMLTNMKIVQNKKAASSQKAALDNEITQSVTELQKF
jgi:hypothetical protein